MATCTNCGANVPIRKSLSGRAIDKQDRDCPDCGEPITPAADRTTLFK